MNCMGKNSQRGTGIKYLFLARCPNDIDHATPVISALLDAGVDAEEIRYVTLIAYPSIDPAHDPRALYLADRGVKLEAPYLSGLGNAILNLSKTDTKYSTGGLRPFLSKAGRYLFSKYVIPKSGSFNSPNWGHVRAIADSMPENGCICFDTDHVLAKELDKICRQKKLNFVCIEHGFPLHRGFTNPEVDKLLSDKPKEIDENIFSHHLCSDPWEAKKKSQKGKNNVSIMGSPRFSPEWIKKLNDIYPPFSTESSKLKVAAVVEKGGVYINGSPCIFLDIEEQFKALNYLASHNGIELKIKTNARGLYKTQSQLLHGLSEHLVPEQIHTGQVFTWADVVVGCCSSVLMDAVVKQKPLIQLRYATPLKLSFYEESLGWQPESFGEFCKMIDILVESTESFQYEETGWNNIVNFYVYGGKGVHNVMQAYATFLRGLADR